MQKMKENTRENSGINQKRLVNQTRRWNMGLQKCIQDLNWLISFSTGVWKIMSFTSWNGTQSILGSEIPKFWWEGIQGAKEDSTFGIRRNVIDNVWIFKNLQERVKAYHDKKLLKRDLKSGLSYPNFVRGPSVCWDATLVWPLRGTWHPSLGNPWSSVTCRKSKESIVAQSVKFRNIPEAKKGMIT